MTKNNWHDKQDRTEKSTFKPKWTPETIEWIITQLIEMVDFIDIKYQLVKKHAISLSSAALWIEMARRINTDMLNGLSMDKALERDQERRNLMRRRLKKD